MCGLRFWGLGFVHMNVYPAGEVLHTCSYEFIYIYLYVLDLAIALVCVFCNLHGHAAAQDVIPVSQASHSKTSG